MDAMPGTYRIARALGLGALITAGAAVALWLVAIAVLIAPLAFWFAWNILELGPALGLPELGFWATVLAAAFLVLGWFGKTAVVAIVFLVDPGWLSGETTIHWPEPTLRNFFAIVILAVLASRPHDRDRHDRREKQTSDR